MIARLRSAYRFREGLFRLVPPAPNKFGLALPRRINLFGIEKVFALGRSLESVSLSVFHALVNAKAHTTEFRVYLKLWSRTWKWTFPGPTYALKERL